MTLFRDLALADRPRERLSLSGASALSDAELLAILLGSGMKGRDVFKVAYDVLSTVDQHWPRLETHHLIDIPGVGAAKATLIVAALEFARRRIRPAGVVIGGPQDVLPLVRHLADRKQEHLICISLNGANEVIASRVVTIGLVNSTQIHPREIFCDPITDRACGIIAAHNHPSGNVLPSEEDKEVTQVLKDAGRILGIELLDHVIFTTKKFYSFAEEGIL